MKNKKAGNVLDELLSREEYLVVQGNDLAKSFGNLRAFEHKLLDYCFSYVTRESGKNEVFKADTSTILKFFGLNASGQNYKRVAESFKTLNENTALYFSKIREDGKRSIVMAQLFSFIEFVEDGVVEFKFSEVAQPYVFDLKRNFYSFHLRELSQIKGKHSLILLKLWEANRFGDSPLTLIQGGLEEWQEWFLGSAKRLPAGVFKRDVLTRASEELEKKLNCEITLKTAKKGRVVIGYEMEIEDKRIVRPVIDAPIDKGEYQSNIYDFLR
ncbi:TPA: replication initiation protein [Streptococcus suis]